MTTKASLSVDYWDGEVTLVIPGDDDSDVDTEHRRLGHVLNPRTTDDCPPELQADLQLEQRNFIDHLGSSPGGGAVMREMHRDGWF